MCDMYVCVLCSIDWHCKFSETAIIFFPSIQPPNKIFGIFFACVFVCMKKIHKLLSEFMGMGIVKGGRNISRIKIKIFSILYFLVFFASSWTLQYQTYLVEMEKKRNKHEKCVTILERTAVHISSELSRINSCTHKLTHIWTQHAR